METLRELLVRFYDHVPSQKYLFPAIVKEFDRIDPERFPSEVRSRFVELRETFSNLHHNRDRLKKIGLPERSDVMNVLEHYIPPRADIVSQVRDWTRQNPCTAWPIIVILALTVLATAANQVWSLIDKITR